jgi:hypothetical protein
MTFEDNDMRGLTIDEIDGVAGGVFGQVLAFNGSSKSSVIGPISLSATTMGLGSFAYASANVKSGTVVSNSSASVTGNGTASASSTVILI